jgi:hypothetical protein
MNAHPALAPRRHLVARVRYRAQSDGELPRPAATLTVAAVPGRLACITPLRETHLLHRPLLAQARVVPSRCWWRPDRRPKGEECVSLRGRDPRQPGDIQALVGAMRPQGAQQGAAAGVPEPHRAVEPATGHHAPIRAERQAPDPGGMAPQYREWLAAARVPQSRRAIGPAGSRLIVSILVRVSTTATIDNRGTP